MIDALTKEQAEQVYKVLAEECHASTRPDDVASFVYEFTRPSPYRFGREWRFQGSLGFGGKFRFPALSVDCYPEDSTPVRCAAIASANNKLKELKQSFGL